MARQKQFTRFKNDRGVVNQSLEPFPKKMNEKEETLLKNQAQS